MTDMQTMSHESSGLCWCGPNNHGPARSHPQCWTGTEYAHKCHEPSGRECIEEGCAAAAGTWWGPYWCPAHDVARLDGISENLARIVSEG